MHWQLTPTKRWSLDRPKILAIVNVTPDSFSDGGRFTSAEQLADAAQRLLTEGAHGLDVGGESTRPGAARVSAAEQIARVVPAITRIRQRVGDEPVITIDTTLEPVALAALDAGADAINDQSAGLEDPRLFALAHERQRGIILMHRLAPPGNDSYSTRYGHPGERAAPVYTDVVREVGAFLAQRADEARRAGIDPRAIVIDPGLGFGKSVEQNLALIERTGELCALGYPVLSGLSRKSFVGAWATLPQGHAPTDRDAATRRLSLRHVQAGATILRVHDPAPLAAALGS